MTKNVVLCLDGTNNEIRAKCNTNVVRLYNMLDLTAPAEQVAYYAPGVGTFSSPAAGTALERDVSIGEGLAFGVGLQQELENAYTYLMSAYEDGDAVFVFGFSRGAYTARALTGLLDLIGLFRPGAENLVPYAVSVYTGNGQEDWGALRQYAESFARVIGTEKTNRIPVHFVGLWDTVKAAGTLHGELTWPYTRHLRRVATVRHAMAIDEKRRPYAPYPVEDPDPAAGDPESAQDLLQVWFAGVHSDVGGMFPGERSRLSDVPLKWMAQHAVRNGLRVVPATFDTYMTQVQLSCATDPVHKMSLLWDVAGITHRAVAPGALVHASVRNRIDTDNDYGRHLADVRYVDDDWLTASESIDARGYFAPPG